MFLLSKRYAREYLLPSQIDFCDKLFRDNFSADLSLIISVKKLQIFRNRIFHLRHDWILSLLRIACFKYEVTLLYGIWFLTFVLTIYCCLVNIICVFFCNFKQQNTVNEGWVGCIACICCLQLLLSRWFFFRIAVMS